MAAVEVWNTRPQADRALNLLREYAHPPQERPDDFYMKWGVEVRRLLEKEGMENG